MSRPYLDALMCGRRGGRAEGISPQKELVGQFKNAGQEWRPKGQPERVKVHDFEEAEQGKAIPYGVYDIGQDAGWVSVGQDHDTASFAVESPRRWWGQAGRPA